MLWWSTCTENWFWWQNVWGAPKLVISSSEFFTNTGHFVPGGGGGGLPYETDVENVEFNLLGGDHLGMAEANFDA